MSESYPSKRERWQRLRAALPAELQPHVSLRNVEAVSGLTPEAQKRLLEAIQAGLKRLPGAIEQLKANPETPVSELLKPTPQSHPQQKHSEEIQKELADLVQACYPDMPRLSAEALAEADAMQEVGAVAMAFEAVMACPHLNSEFVLVVLYALVSQALAQLDTLIAESSTAQGVLAHSEPSHLSTQWRHSNA